MPDNNSHQRLFHPVAINLSLNKKARHNAKRLIRKRLLRIPNLPLLWRQAEAVGG